MTEFPEDNPIPPRVVESLTTPIDHEYAQKLVTMLLAHGARVQQLDMFLHSTRLPDGSYQEKPCSNHCISFPLGTMRYDGLVLSHSQAFRILFPDGFLLRGVYLMSFGEEASKTVLYLPKEAEPEPE